MKRLPDQVLHPARFTSDILYMRRPRRVRGYKKRQSQRSGTVAIVEPLPKH